MNFSSSLSPDSFVLCAYKTLMIQCINLSKIYGRFRPWSLFVILNVCHILYTTLYFKCCCLYCLCHFLQTHTTPLYFAIMRQQTDVIDHMLNSSPSLDPNIKSNMDEVTIVLRILYVAWGRCEVHVNVLIHCVCCFRHDLIVQERFS